MTDNTSPDSGTYEKPDDKGSDERALWKLWMSAIELASDEEKDWRKEAEEAEKLYASGKTTAPNQPQPDFNILYTNTQTLVPALYNSTPEPDTRRRWNDQDPIGKVVAQMCERAQEVTIDQQDFDDLMFSSVEDSEIAGRGVMRVRYVPTMTPEQEPAEGQEPQAPQVASQRVEFEHVAWADYRHGPAKRREKLPWEAFRHYMTREQLEALNPKVGPLVKLESNLKGVDEKWKNDGAGDQPPDLFKRAEVWEIWNKEKRETIWIAVSWKDGPLRVDEDLLGLEKFFCTPRPLYGVQRTATLVPVVPYEMYRKQAQQLNDLTRRLGKLINALRFRGLGHSQIADALEKLKDLEDGQLAAINDEMTFSDKGIEQLVWLMPIDQLAKTIVELYTAREECKKTIYEITGVADILRGSSDPRETLGAQKIKAQWGSLRLNRRQQEVARYARDLFRLAVEIIANKFSPQQIMLMTGIKLPSQQEKDQAQALQQQAASNPAMGAQLQQMVTPETVAYLQQPSIEEVMQVLRRDLLREYKVDIETDSTVRADVERQQQNIGQFVQGLGSLGQALMPAVEGGVMPLDVAADLITGFARVFKLGKQAEDALDRWGEQAKQQSQQPKEDPAAAAEKAKAEAEMQRIKLDGEIAQSEHGMKMEEMQASHSVKMAQVKAQQETMILKATLPEPQQQGGMPQ